jgi:murein DD-endopeptidase MepM/ murein hydrolase activator NlpD
VGVNPLRDRSRSACVVGFLLAATAVAGAQDMTNPRVSFAQIDWNPVVVELSAWEPFRFLPTTLAAGEAGSVGMPSAIAQLNAATAARFPNIAASPVPVLLPFDTAAFLHDHARGEPPAAASNRYLSGFDAGIFFHPGSSGYDAAFLVRPNDVPELASLGISREVEVQISGSTLLYELGAPVAVIGTPVPALEAEFPGVRRLILDADVRYTFVRYGVPYVVSIGCVDGRGRARRIACRAADQIAVRFLKALRVVGGTPRPHLEAPHPQTIEQPAETSPTFTYHAPGKLIPGSGMRGNDGRADRTVYARLRFPIAEAPAYANSQSFMHWGDCDNTGRVGRRGVKGAPYRCRVNGQPLVFDESKNYAYPWRDNFCEHRWFFVGQCPAGLGHQGQDIRPASCAQRNAGADRCIPYRHDVVAVSDAAVLRAPQQASLFLVVNRAGEHVRVRYLHMNPNMLDADRMLTGRAVREGEVIGKVGNYFKFSGGTTYHLHFDMQVPTKDGWVFVNPYMTLVAAYERLIGGRGTEVSDELIASTSAPVGDQTPPAPDTPATPIRIQNVMLEAPEPGAGISEKAFPDDRPQRASVLHCKAKSARGGHRRHCGAHHRRISARAKRAASVRAMGRNVPAAGAVARDF